MESIQLRNIQNIQNSLSLLKLKIQNMSRLSNHQQQTLDRLISTTAPLVQKKIKETQLREQTHIKQQSFLHRCHTLKKRNEQSRVLNQKQIARSRQLIALMKHHNSLHLKQSTKHNQQKIRKIRELNLNEKKQRRAIVKQKELQSQARIQQFHTHKQEDLRLKRDQETKENQEKIQLLMNQLRGLAQKEGMMEGKIRSSEEHINKFKGVIHSVEKMKFEELMRLKSDVGSPALKDGTRSFSEAILLYAASKSG